MSAAGSVARRTVTPSEAPPRWDCVAVDRGPPVDNQAIWGLGGACLNDKELVDPTFGEVALNPENVCSDLLKRM